jgi:hypothetical protein
MILGMEIGLLIGGILALVRGRMSFSKNKVATGTPARIAGIIMLLPIPLAFGVIFCYAFLMGASGAVVDENSLRGTAIVIEIAIVVLCFAVAMLIAGVFGESPFDVKKRKRLERFDEDYDDDDRDSQPRKRRRSSGDDVIDDYDEEPRR